MSDSGSRFLKIEKLNGENYQFWSYQIEILLIKDKLWEVIKKDAPVPMTTEWQDKDDQARATIGLSVEINQLVHIRNCTSAKEAWRALKSYH